MTAAKRLLAETLKPCLDPGNPAGDADFEDLMPEEQPKTR